MRVRVLGCSGGISVRDRGVSLLFDDRLAIDAGSVASGTSLQEQRALESILISHSHLDHVGDLGALSDTRLQQEGSPFTVFGTAESIEALRLHYFNDVLWPDFTVIPTPDHPIVRYQEIEEEKPISVSGFDALAIRVDHTVPSCGFLIGQGEYSVAYSGDTRPTERFWSVMNDTPSLRVLITEVSFPNHMQELADLSGHLTPQTFAREMTKLRAASELRILIYGMKPTFLEEIASEVASLEMDNVELLSNESRFEF